MRPIENLLFDACENGDLEVVKDLLENNPDISVNQGDRYGWRALHFACDKSHHEIVLILLKHPRINVNPQTEDGSTPLHLAFHIEVIKLLLKDSRVDVNIAECFGGTPLWTASSCGDIEMVRWLIALRGDELDLDKTGKDYGTTEYSAIEIARRENMTEVTSLLERFMDHPTQTRHEVRAELGLVNVEAAELFAMVVFICDDLLKVKTLPTDSRVLRFFNMITKLPMELQMVLCYRVFGSMKHNILSKDSEVAFKALAISDNDNDNDNDN
jgi:hypothetical protein